MSHADKVDAAARRTQKIGGAATVYVTLPLLTVGATAVFGWVAFVIGGLVTLLAIAARNG